MNGPVATWTLAAVLAASSPIARAQSAGSEVDQSNPGVAKTNQQSPRTKDAPSDVRDLDPTEEVPSEQNTQVGTSRAKRRKGSRKAAPSDVRNLDPTRAVPGTDAEETGPTGDQGK